MANIDSARNALQELRTRFIAAGIADEFRPRKIPPSDGDGLWQLVCVDAQERVILGVHSVGYRPTICDATIVARFVQRVPECDASA